MGEGVSSSVVYGLTTKARCFTSRIAETENVQFFVGTLSLKEENEIHLIEVRHDDDDVQVKCISIFSHQNEIWHMSACPSDRNLLFTVYNCVTYPSVPSSGNSFRNDFKVSLWKIKEEDSSLEEIVQLKDHAGMIKCILWNPSEKKPETVVSLDESNIQVWNLERPQKRIAYVADLPRLTNGCWNPLHSEQIVTVNDSTVSGWDLRTMREAYSITRAHIFVRDVDFNPLRDYYMVTGGDDYKIKFWDIRKPNRTLKTLSGKHQHWVWNVKYNPEYDHLVLSSSTDCLVNLWNVSSLCSDAERMYRYAN